MELLIACLASVVLSIVGFVYTQTQLQNRYVTLGDFIVMLVGSLLPVVNIVSVLFLLFDGSSAKSIVVFKAKKKKKNA